MERQPTKMKISQSPFKLRKANQFSQTNHIHQEKPKQNSHSGIEKMGVLTLPTHDCSVWVFPDECGLFG